MERETAKNVTVHIDRRPHHSPNPTTAELLYQLGSVRDGFVLYQETFGDEEDRIVHKGPQEIHLLEGEHFYSAEHHERGIAIFVNTVEKVVHQQRLTYEQIVALAALTPGPADIVTYLVTYEMGPRHKPDGSVVAGQTIKIRKGMIFDVSATNRS